MPKSTTAELTLDPVVTLGNVQELHARLRGAMTAGDLVIDAILLEKCDFSLVQLLVSACRSAAAAGQRLQLRATPDGELASRWRQAGLPVETFQSLISTRQ
ncbi:STAS domain-containing protein [Parapedomonas caeni]